MVREVKVQSAHFSNDGGATPSYTGISHDVVAGVTIELSRIKDKMITVRYIVSD